jgi:hypothetical protein
MSPATGSSLPQYPIPPIPQTPICAENAEGLTYVYSADEHDILWWERSDGETGLVHVDPNIEAEPNDEPFDKEKNDLLRELTLYRAFNGEDSFAADDVDGYREFKESWGITDEHCYRELEKMKASCKTVGNTYYGPTYIPQPPPMPKHPPVSFSKPAVRGTPYDYVVAPPSAQWEGWFPRGDVSLVGGSSGAGKSTWMLPLLDAQSKGEEFMGFQTYGLPYLMIVFDRSKNSVTRTFRRLDRDQAEIPTAKVKRGPDFAHTLCSAIERQPVMPAVVFFEGLDLVTSDAGKMGDVSLFVEQLQHIARHYHLALVGTVGAPKMKPKEKYENLRERFFGSTAWGRMAETMVLVNEEPDHSRKVFVLNRQRSMDLFRTKFVNGRLEVVKDLEPSEDVKMGQWFLAEVRHEVVEKVAKSFRISSCFREVYTTF